MPRFAANDVVTSRTGRLSNDLSNDFSGRDGDGDALLSGYSDANRSELDEANADRASQLMRKEVVFPLVMRVRQEVITMIDTPLSLEQFRSPAINFSVVRPLLLRLSKGGRPAPPLIWSLLANRSNFLDEAENDLAFMALNTSRADLCELLAIKLLSAYNSETNELLHVLTMPFSPFRGASSDMFSEDEAISKQDLEDLQKWSDDECTNALELAIYTQSKRFVKSPLVQQFINAIYVGDLTYSPVSSHSLIRDDYKRRPIVEPYDWRRKPFIDHYRLRVPIVRTRLDLLTFASILVLFLVAQGTRNYDHVNVWELLFIFWSLGFMLDEFASIKENGLRPYLIGSYNVLDSLYCLIFAFYLGIRSVALATADIERSKLAFDTLALAACVLFPRLSISLVRGNVVLLALSSMIFEYALFMGLSILTASGFYVTLHILAEGKWGWGRLGWLMFQIFSGSAYVGYNVAGDFHPVFGPVLIVLFAILSSTLLVTILISLLSNTFALIQANSETEILYQKSLRTIERVKADALSSYFPPLNLVALIVLTVVKPFVTPRYFHKINTTIVRVLNFPILFFLAVEVRLRHSNKLGRLNLTESTQKAWRSLPRGLGWDGAADHVHEVFRRKTTGAALDVPDMEAFVDVFDGAESESEPAAQKSKAHHPTASQVEDQDQPQGVPSTTLASPQSPTKRASSSATAAAATTASKEINPRLGSLASPLAKIFMSSGGEPKSSSTKDGKNDDKRQKQETRAAMRASANERSAFVSGDVIRRLEAIEQALAVLVGEVAKGSDVGKKEDVPLTSLTGKREESYADE